MIIHSYLTDGMYNWGFVFLESFKEHNGEDIPIIFTTRDLKKKQINELKKTYKNLEIRNQNIDYDYLSKRSGLSIKKIKSYKRQIEHGNVNKENKIWKQYISVEDRYRNTIVDIMDDYINSEHSHMIHIDIDMYFRGDISDLIQQVEDNDITIKFRDKSQKKAQKDNRRVLGSIIGLKLDDHVRKFMDVWIKYIDNVHLKEKKKGYGQGSFWYAYLETEDQYKWGNIGKEYATPGENEDAIIWAGNKGKKDKKLQSFKNHMGKE